MTATVSIPWTFSEVGVSTTTATGAEIPASRTEPDPDPDRAPSEALYRSACSGVQ